MIATANFNSFLSPMVSLWNLQFFDPMPCRSAKLLSMPVCFISCPSSACRGHFGTERCYGHPMLLSTVVAAVAAMKVNLSLNAV